MLSMPVSGEVFKPGEALRDDPAWLIQTRWRRPFSRPSGCVVNWPRWMDETSYSAFSRWTLKFIFRVF
jgi:hypothetical protein